MSSIGKSEDDHHNQQYITFNKSDDDNNSINSNTEAELGKFNSFEIKSPASQALKESYNTGLWSRDERRKYFEGIIKYPNSWKDIQRHIKTRNSYQVRSFSQKVFFKLKTKHKESKDEYNNIFLEERYLVKEFESLCNEINLSEEYYDLYTAKKNIIIDRIKYLNKQNFKVENRIANIANTQYDDDKERNRSKSDLTIYYTSKPDSNPKRWKIPRI